MKSYCKSAVTVKLCAALLLGLVALVTSAIPAEAATIIVTTNADSGAGSLRQAIADATPGDTITFDAALSGQSINLATVGDNTFGPSALLVSTNITIDAGSSKITISRDTTAAPDRLRLFYVAPTGNLTLKNLTLSNGLARGGNSKFSGGGAAGLGGAVVNTGTLALQSSSLTNNIAQGGSVEGISGTNSGGGLGGDSDVVVGGPPNGGAANFSGNGGNGGFGGGGGLGSVQGGNGGFGGGGGFGNGSIGGNGGFGGGGGFGRTVPGNGGFGGGSANANVSGGGAGLGGAIFNYGGTLIVENSTLAGNAAVRGYGYNGGGNGKGYGGAVFNLNGSVTTTNATLASNTANDGGGAIYSLGDNGIATQSGPALPSTTATVALNNTILAGSNDGGSTPALVSDYVQNTNNSGNGGGAGSVSSSGTNNIIQTSATNFSGSATQADPKLNALADNSGVTQTMALQGSSPAIDAANDVVAPATDQRGVARPQGSAADIGAYERSSPTFDHATVTIDKSTMQVGETYTVTIDNIRDIYNDPYLPNKVMIYRKGLPLGTRNKTFGFLHPESSYLHTEPLDSPANYIIEVVFDENESKAVSFLLTVTEAPSLVVTTESDESTNIDGLTSLREAINYANSKSGADEITFSNTTTNDATNFHDGTARTITLLTALDALNDDVTITGPGANKLTVARSSANGTPDFRIFTINAGKTVTISGLTMSNGQASSIFPDNVAGGIYNQGTLTINDCTLSGNSAFFAGGIYNTGTLTVRNSTLSDNLGTFQCGGIFNGNGTVTVRNSTLSGNSGGGSGGGIRNSGTLTVQNSTFSGNSATDGGGIYHNTGTVNIGNSILHKGSGSGDNYISDTGTLNSDGFNVSSDGTGPNNGTTDQINTDPKLDPLGDYGGPTQTHRLQSGSPAINAGDTTLTTDQRGIARPQAGRDDIGAFELEASNFNESLVVTTSTDEDNGTSDPAYGSGTSLREAIAYANIKSGDDTITFSDGTGGTINFGDGAQRTITLGGTQLLISSNITITGPGAAKLTVSGNNASRVFSVAASQSLNLSDITVTNGKSTDGAGIYNLGSLTLLNCVISASWATGNGGGIYVAGGAVTATNTVISGNLAGGRGGGIWMNTTALRLTNCTISGNSASNLGGGIRNENGPSSWTIRNSIVWGNSAINPSSADMANGSGMITNISNSIGPTNWFFNLEVDPQFVTPIDLQNTPAPTTTGNLRLKAGSPAINGGNNSVTNPTLPATDLDGAARIKYGVVDIGAYEFDGATESLVVTTAQDEDNGTSDPAIGSGTSLREAIIYANVKPNADANTPDEITFSSLFNSAQTIQLSSALPNINDNVAITGPGATLLTVQASTETFDILTVNSSKSLSLSGLTVNNGLVGLNNDSGTVTASNCTFSGSEVGLYNGGSLTATNCTFSGNTGSGMGNGGTATASSCTFNGNSYGINSGGLSGVTVTNCTFSGNTNSGIFTGADLGVTATNCTFSGNNQGVYSISGYVRLKNSICAGNTTNILGNVDADGANNFTSGTAAQAGLDPNGLQDNGGPTQTIKLLSGSPAINAGDNALIPNGVTIDQRGAGFPRIKGGTVDIGAFEVQNELPVNLSLTPTPNPLNEGGTLSLSGSFDDPDSGDTHTVVINWGDGSTNSTLNLGAGVKSFSNATHQYSDNGSYTISATVTDAFGANTGATTGITVNNVAPTATFGNGGAVIVGNTGTVSFSAQADVSSVDTTAGFRYAYDFNNDGDFGDAGEIGDGTYAGSSTDASVTVPAAYLSTPGNHIVRGRIIDKDGGSTDYTTGIAVNEVPSLIVTTSQDVTDSQDGLTSLREAITFANNDGVDSAITFDATVFASRQTITLTAQLPDNDHVLSLTGPTASGAGVTIDGAGNNILHSYGTSLTLRSLTFAGGGSESVENWAGDMLIENCTFNASGRALVTRNTMTVRNTTVTGSSVVGLSVLSGGTATVESCTIAGNSAGISDGPGAGTLNLSNSIVANNGTNIGAGLTIGTNTNNIVVATNPGLAALADNGGPTKTMALLYGSPAIDAGNTSVATDQRGLPRPVGASSDIGAFEVQATYSISGYARVGNVTPLSGVSVQLSTTSGAAGSPVLTGANGFYQISGVPAGGYAVTPTLAGWSFNPGAQSLVVTNGNRAANFIATRTTTTYSISGRIANSNGAALPNVSVALTPTQGGVSTPVLTNSAGYYTFSNVPENDYTVTPTLPGYRLAPATRSVTLAGVNATGQNFIASTGYSVSGRTSDSAGAALPGVTIAGVGTATSNSAGYYTFTNVPNGSYSASASKSGYTFSPSSRSIIVSDGNVISQNFVGRSGHLVYGRIATSAGIGIADVEVLLSGRSTPVLTNSAGYYTLRDVPDGEHTVTPSKTGYSFTPVSKSVTVSGANVSGQNFVGSTS